MLYFSLCIQDQGLATPQDSFKIVLVKLHDIFIEKMLRKMEGEITTDMYAKTEEPFNELFVKNDDDFELYVEKFEFELSEYIERSNNATAAINLKRYYPITLPYSIFVVDMLNLMTKFVDKNLDYWQFLLNDMSDLILVSYSCDKILLRAKQAICEIFSDSA